MLLLVAAFISGSTPFDLQAAINACRAGGTVSIPAGTIAITGPIDLKSGVTLRGAGIDQTILMMPPKTTPTSLLQGIGVSNVGIFDLTLTSPAAADYVFALQLSTYSNVDVERVKVTNCMYALKADTRGANLTVRDFTAQACGQLYVANLTGGLFERLDLEMVTQQLAGGAYGSFHCLYLCNSNHNLRFNDVKAIGGESFAVQCWSDYDWTYPSGDIVFNGLVVSNTHAVVIGTGYDGVTIDNLNAVATDAGLALVQLEAPRNVTIEGFTASGGSALVGTYDSQPDRAQNITFRNGTYNGPQLQYGNKIDNLVMDNVSTGALNATSS